MVTPGIIEAELVTTLDKRELVATLKVWRGEATNKDEADVIVELLQRITSGEFDG